MCTIEVTGKGTDFTADPGYQLSITNNSSATIYVIPEDEFTIDGKGYEAGIGEVVDPGETIETFIYFSASELGGGAEKLKDVEGTLVVGDDDSGKQLKTYTFKMD